MLTTVFLGVLIIALALGNAFLSATAPKKPKNAPAWEQNNGSRLMLPVAETGNPQTNAVVAKLPSSSSRINAFEKELEREKIRYLNKRMARLEQLLLKMDNNGFIAQKINASNLSQRLGGLEEFKEKTRLEMAALKQRLDEIKPNKIKPKENIPEISDEKLHAMVFRSKH